MWEYRPRNNTTTASKKSVEIYDGPKTDLFTRKETLQKSFLINDNIMFTQNGGITMIKVKSQEKSWPHHLHTVGVYNRQRRK